MQHLSIIIPHYEKQEALKKVLDELTLQISPQEEIVVVDDYSPDGVPDCDCPTVRIIRPPKHGSHIYRLNTLRNTGIRHAKHDAILILDPDCLPDPDLLKNAKALFYRGILYGGRIDLQQSDGTVKEDPRVASGRSDVYGGLMLFSKERTWSVGWFDTDYDGNWGLDDIDFAHRCYHSGMVVSYTQHLRAMHLWHPKSRGGHNVNKQLLTSKRHAYMTKLDEVTPYKPKTAIIIPTSKTLALLDKCLTRIASLTTPVRIYLAGQRDNKQRTIINQWKTKWAVEHVTGDYLSLEAVKEKAIRKARDAGYQHITVLDGDCARARTWGDSMERRIRVLTILDVYGWAYDVGCSGLYRELHRRHPNWVLQKCLHPDVVEGNVDPRKFDIVFAWVWCEGPDHRIVVKKNLLSRLDPRKSVLVVASEGVLRNMGQLSHSIRGFPYIAGNSWRMVEALKKTMPHKHIFQFDYGVELDRFKPQPFPEQFVVGWVGHVQRKLKRFELADQIYRKTGIRIKLAGHITSKQYIPHKRMPKFYSEISCLLITSDSEVHPLVYYEALASGRPVVSTLVGDISSTAREGLNGFYLPVDCTTDQIEDRLIKLRDDRELLARMGEQARRDAEEKWNWSKVAERYLVAIKEITGEPPKTNKSREEKPRQNQIRIAFVWGYPNFYKGFWENKIDSMQHAIAKLSVYNPVQVFVPTNQIPHRKNINGQDITFYKHNNFRNLMGFLTEFSPDMIFLNMFRCNLWSQVVEAFPDAWKSVMHYGDQSLLIPYADKLDMVFVQQEYLRKPVAEKNSIPVEKVQTNSFCIETSNFKPVKTEKKYTGIMVADFRRDIKRQDLLIRAWKHIPGRLLLVGRFARSKPSNYHEECQKLATELGVAKRIEFVDNYPHNQLPTLINQAKIAFLTSSQEGGSRALVEMMACGLPVVVLSDCIGATNMIRVGVDGLVADPNPSSITEQTMKLLEGYEKMGEAASQRMRRDYPYDKMHQVLQKHVAEYRPEISIITTSMNLGEFIEENIKSVIAQRRKGLKVNHIIMDGGSTDNTISILERYSEQIHAYVGRDKGQTDALVKAMEIIEEEFPQTSYVGWINADDYYELNWLEDSLSQLRGEPPDVAMTCGDGRLVGMYTGPLHYTSQLYVDLKLLGTRGNIIVQPTVLMRFSMLKKIKEKYGYYFNPELDYVQDLDLWHRFLINGYRIKHLTKNGRGLNIVANLRMHPKQLSRTHSKEQTVERDVILRAICVREGISELPWMKH